MRKLVKRLAVFVLAAVMLAAMPACSSASEAEYTQKVEEVVTRLSEASSAFYSDVETLFRDLTDEKRTKVMGDLDEMEAVFKEIAALEAPKKYEEVQNCLSQSADSALKGIAVYRTELGAVTADTVDDAFLERVAEGDGYLQDAQDKMMEAAELVGSLDS